MRSVRRRAGQGPGEDPGASMPCPGRGSQGDTRALVGTRSHVRCVWVMGPARLSVGSVGAGDGCGRRAHVGRRTLASGCPWGPLRTAPSGRQGASQEDGPRGRAPGGRGGRQEDKDEDGRAGLALEQVLESGASSRWGLGGARGEGCPWAEGRLGAGTGARTPEGGQGRVPLEYGPRGAHLSGLMWPSLTLHAPKGCGEAPRMEQLTAKWGSKGSD